VGNDVYGGTFRYLERVRRLAKRLPPLFAHAHASCAPFLTYFPITAAPRFLHHFLAPISSCGDVTARESSDPVVGARK
jgi:hypothetical protein